MTGSRRVVAALVLVVLGVLAGARPAAAHAQLVETNPVDDSMVEEVPAEVGLRFDEAMEVTPDAIRVLGPGGDRVESSTTRLSDDAMELTAAIDPAGRGTYTVGWRATSEDGHTLTGSFVFHVEVRTGAQDIDTGRPATVAGTAGVGRWLGFAGALTAVGAAVLALLADASARRRLRLVVAIGAAVGAVGTVVLLVAETATSSGRGLLAAVSVVPDIGLGSRTGELIAWRAALLLLAAGFAAVPVVWRRARAITLVPLAAAVATSSAGGHAWTVDSRSLAVGADALHMAAAGAWVGGLVALLVALQTSDDRGRLVRRFSTATLGFVAVVVVTGVVSGLLQVPSLDGLTGTTYGQVLLTKVALVAVLLVIGWVNRRRIVPAGERLLGALTRNVRVEVVVAAILLAVTAGLVEQTPARVAVDQPVDQIVRTDQGTMQVTVDPARVGTNTIHLYFYDASGSQPLNVDAVELWASVGDIPPRRLDVVPVTQSHVSAYGAALGAPGTWALEATAVSGGTTITFTTEVPIR